ncbi:MAG: hypothetical protein KDK37_16855, partial [Leptospiraceae bacterium]|nr:hypothetical protein [Leptospiraceae bacterium]
MAHKHWLLPGLKLGWEIVLILAILKSLWSYRWKAAPLGICFLPHMIGFLVEAALPDWQFAEFAPPGGNLIALLSFSALLALGNRASNRKRTQAEARSRGLQNVAFRALREAEDVKEAFWHRMNTLLASPLAELRASASALFNSGSHGRQEDLRRIIAETDRIIHLLDRSSPIEEEADRLISAANLVEDTLAIVSMFPPEMYCGLKNDVEPRYFVRLQARGFVRLLTSLIQNYILLRNCKSVRVVASSIGNDLEIKIEETETTMGSIGMNRSDAGRTTLARIEMEFLNQSAVALLPSVRIQSQGDGSVTLRVPLHPPPEADLESSGALSAAQSNQTVAVISTDPLYGSRVQSWLRDSGYGVQSIPLQTIGAMSKVTALVLDLVSVDEDTISMVRAFRRNQPVPVLLLIRADAGGSRIYDPGPGIIEQVEKPFFEEQFLSALSALLASQDRLNREKEKYNDLSRSIPGRLSRQLHDSLGSRLTDLRILADRLNSEASHGSEQLAAEIQETISLLHDCIAETDESSALTEDLSLGIEEHIVRRYTRAGRKIRRTFFREPRGLAPGAAEELFRTVQELVTNDLKYGFGSSEWQLSTEGSALLLSVKAASKYESSGAAG